MKHIQKLQTKTSSFDLSWEGLLSIPALIRNFQQAAHEHATNLKVGYHQLKKENVFWVLSAITIKLNDLPEFDEAFSIETMPVDFNGFFTSREFLAQTKDKIIAKASSQWLMVNTLTKRPVRPDKRVENLPFTPSGFNLNFSTEKIKMPKDMLLIEERKVRYSDLDINNHVNNVKYLEWILDMIHDKGYGNIKITSLSLKYAGEFRKNDKALLYMNEEEKNNLYIKIAHKNKISGILCKISYK